MRRSRLMRAPDFWAAPPGVAARLLAPLAAVWGVAARLRSAAAPAARAPVAVVCVGNLVAGGTGKTPVVLALTALAAARGVAAHVVTRGYGGRAAGPLRVDPTRHDAAVVGDEALLIAAAAPCWVARDRLGGARAAAAAGADLVVLDDGHQNPTIAKDLSLLVVDAEFGFGNGRLIPAGPLREPIAAGLARADAVVLIGDGEPPPAVRASALPILRARLQPLDGDRFAGAPVIAFAGIGRPAKFFAGLAALGATLVAARAFPDHHRYRRREVARLRREAARAGARLVTTAKDWVRLPAALRRDIEVLEVAVRWDDPAAAARLLARVLPAAFDGYDDRRAARA
jgi:tetraacyldisaccharide 4'-kinase